MATDQTSLHRYDNDIMLVRTEQDEVSSLLRQGDEGVRQLRVRRVSAYMTGVVLEKGWIDNREAATVPLLTLAEEVDGIIGGRPNSLTFLDVEKGLGGKEHSDAIRDATEALWRTTPSAGSFYTRVLDFLHTYHTMHAARLITPEAVDVYRELAKKPEIQRTLVPGRQSNSHGLSSIGYPEQSDPFPMEVRPLGWNSLRSKRSTSLRLPPDPAFRKNRSRKANGNSSRS